MPRRLATGPVDLGTTIRASLSFARGVNTLASTQARADCAITASLCRLHLLVTRELPSSWRGRGQAPVLSSGRNAPTMSRVMNVGEVET